MKDKIMGKTSLMIAMAKLIKAQKKELKTCHITSMEFVFNLVGGQTEVHCKDKVFSLGEGLSIEEATEIAEKALSESGCNGVIHQEANIYRVTLFGKPVKEFNMLQRLVKKYSGIEVGWDDIYMCYDGLTIYLCYNEEECQSGVDFIRRFRTSKDVLKTHLLSDYEVGSGCTATALKLVVETPHGRKKAEITLLA